MELEEALIELQILYEDNHLLAVVKPAGISVEGNASKRLSLLDISREWLRRKYHKRGNVFVGIIHRLDRPVSGVWLVAKTSKGASRLSEQFRSRTIKKIYWAVVEGSVEKDHDTLTHYLQSNVRSCLHYRVKKRTSRYSVLEIILETGRKHQIRAQLSSMGHPIWGDRKYGSKTAANSISLVAKRIEFFHPIRTDELIVVEVPDTLLVEP